MVRWFAVLLVFSSLSINAAFAEAPDIPSQAQAVLVTEKASAQLIEKMSAGTPQDFIVVYDDKAVDAEF